MKAVARLVYSYFMGAPVTRAFTIVGLVLLAIDFYMLTALPQSGGTLWAAILGLIAFFTGSSLMPVMFGRLARSHSIRVLPHGRIKLLASAFITTVLVALPAGILSLAAFTSGVSVSKSLLVLAEDPKILAFVLQATELTFTSSFLLVCWLYLAMWFITSERNLAGFIKGLLVVMVAIFAPAREIRDLSVSLVWNLQQIAAIWIVFGAGFLLWPRYRAAIARRGRSRFASFGNKLGPGISGREFDLLLGTANPWLLIAAQVCPIVIATRIGYDTPSVWLYYLTIFSTVAGAIAGQAAERSRALWLRGDWSRDALFTQVERAFWRHNSYVLGSLLLLMVGIGSYAGFSVTMLAAGLPLLVLGTVLSTYLGLMITRGLRTLEALLGVGVMLSLMAVSVLVASERVDLVAVITLEVCLAVLAVVLRSVARRRWTQIDWMACRRDRALSARGA